MADLVTVADLIQEVRDQANEQNTATFGDTAILRMLNRGRRFITSEMLRQGYTEPLLGPLYTLDTTNYQVSGSANLGIAMPSDAYEDRILKVWVNTQQQPTPLEKRAYNQVDAFNYSQSVPVPQYWMQKGRQIITVPPMQATYTLLLDYVRQPDQYVVPLGRLSNWDSTGGTWVVVDSLDSTAVSVSTDQMNSFVNLVDGITGLVKCTLQLASINANKLTFRVTPTYANVYGRTVSANFSSLLTSQTPPTANDYICLASGTCVPQFGTALNGGVVQYAVAELNRALGAAITQISEAVKKEATEQAARQTAGRPTVTRVKNRSRVWSRNITRIPYSKS